MPLLKERATARSLVSTFVRLCWLSAVRVWGVWDDGQGDILLFLNGFKRFAAPNLPGEMLTYNHAYNRTDRD